MNRTAELASQVRQHLEEVLESPQFSSAERLRQLLSYLVEKALDGEADQTKETVIGVDVFDRTPGYDPKEDAIVRVEAHRLRGRLKRYYLETEPAGDVRFHLPKGSYRIQWKVSSGEEEKAIVGWFGRIPWRAVVSTMTIAVAIGAAAFVYMERSRGTSRPQVLRRLTADAGLTTDPALSPDGRFMLYASDRESGGNLRLWKYDLSTGRSSLVRESQYDDHEPWVSPRGDVVVFRSEREDGGVYRMPLAGGVPEMIARHGRRPRFSPNGNYVLYMIRDERYSPAQIYAVAAGGAEPRRLAVDFADAHNPVWSEDGNWVLFCGTRLSGDPSQEHDWWAIPFPEGVPVKTGVVNQLAALEAKLGTRVRVRGDQLGTPAHWDHNGVLFVAAVGDEQCLWRIRLDKGMKADGPPERLTFGANFDTTAVGMGNRIAFASGSQAVDVFEIPANTRTGKVTGPLRRLTSSPAAEYQPKLAPNAQILAYVAEQGSRRTVYLYDLENRRTRPLGSTRYPADYPVFSPDGKSVAYMYSTRTRMSIIRKQLDGDGETVLAENAGIPSSWSPDGRWLAFEPGALMPFVGVLEVATGKRSALLEAPGWGLRSPKISPDQRWIAFQVDVGASSRRIMVAPFTIGPQRGRESWVNLSEDQSVDYLPEWSPDGRLLYFVSERGSTRSIWARPFDPGSGRFTGKAFAVLPMKEAKQTLLRNYRIGLNRIGLTIAEERIVVSMDMTTTNLWLAESP